MKPIFRKLKPTFSQTIQQHLSREAISKPVILLSISRSQFSAKRSKFEASKITQAHFQLDLSNSQAVKFHAIEKQPHLVADCWRVNMLMVVYLAFIRFP